MSRRGPLTIVTTTCPLKKSSARKFVIHCTANDGAVITYVIDRVTGEILAQTQAPSLRLTSAGWRYRVALGPATSLHPPQRGFACNLWLANAQCPPMNCPHCQGPLTEIDYYGERLIGCVACNRWGKPDDENLVMEPMEKDLEALKSAKQGVRWC